MEIDDDRYQDLSQPLTSMYSGYPPGVVVLALASLVGDAEVIASTGESQVAGTTTTWRVAAVTNDGVAYVEASQDGNSRWQGGGASEEQGELKNVTGWLKPMRGVQSIQLRTLRTTGGFARANDAETSYSLMFLDGSEIHLPLFGTDAISREHASAEAVVDAVRRSLGKGL